MTEIWDYLRVSGRNEIQAWAADERLGVRERARLNQKLDLLAAVGFEKAKSMSYLAGTTGEYNHIYKLVVHAGRMLRPMLCRGPINSNGEVTLLGGAIERDSKLDPPNAAGRAEQRRLEVVDSSRKRTRHERF